MGSQGLNVQVETLYITFMHMWRVDILHFLYMLRLEYKPSHQQIFVLVRKKNQISVKSLMLLLNNQLWLLNYRYSRPLEVALGQWCHRRLQVSPATASHPMTDCQDSLSFCPAVKADSCCSWVCSQSLGSHRSAVKEHSVTEGPVSLHWKGQ